MGPSIIQSSRSRRSKNVRALKQRSPAGGRRAVGKIHRIEKLNHCGNTSLGAEANWVKVCGAQHHLVLYAYCRATLVSSLLTISSAIVWLCAPIKWLARLRESRSSFFAPEVARWAYA